MKKMKLLVLMTLSLPAIFSSAYASSNIKDDVILSSKNTSGVYYSVYSSDTGQVGAPVTPGTTSTQYTISTEPTGSYVDCKNKVYHFVVQGFNNGPIVCKPKVQLYICGVVVSGTVESVNNQYPSFANNAVDTCSVKWQGTGENYDPGWAGGKITVTINSSVK